VPLPGRTEIAAYDAVMALLIQKRILSLSSTANSERDVTWCGILCIIDIISFQEIFDFVLLILPVLPVCENDILRCVRAGERTSSSARYDAVVTMHNVCMLSVFCALFVCCSKVEAIHVERGWREEGSFVVHRKRVFKTGYHRDAMDAWWRIVVGRAGTSTQQ